LESDPGTYEPGVERNYSSRFADGINYNKHSFVECLEYTAAIYNAVFNEDQLPRSIAPFGDILKRRAYSALDFLMQKLDDFIVLNGNQSVIRLEADINFGHKGVRMVDLRMIRARLEQAQASIPDDLRVHTFSDEEQVAIQRRRNEMNAYLRNNPNAGQGLPRQRNLGNLIPAFDNFGNNNSFSNNGNILN
jgi:hypothetical protein